MIVRTVYQSLDELSLAEIAESNIILSNRTGKILKNLLDPDLEEVPIRYSFWRHTKTRTDYIVTGYCIDEKSTSLCVIYANRTFRRGLPWVRPAAEFMDGRFVALAGKANGRPGGT